MRLATSLNYACFLYEILDDVEAAISVLKRGHDDALKSYNAVENANADATTRVMVLMSNNIEVWMLEARHVRALQDREQFKQIHKKLAIHGINLNEDADFEFGEE